MVADEPAERGVPVTEAHRFTLRRFPHRLMRSLGGFALAGTVMAAVVWSDGMGRPWIPVAIALGAWAVPLAFAWQVYRRGFDPLRALELGEGGIKADYEDGTQRFVPWSAITRLVAVEAFRYRAWAVVSAEGPIRWFGEPEDAEGLRRELAERSGLAWEHESRLPDEAC